VGHQSVCGHRRGGWRKAMTPAHRAAGFTWHEWQTVKDYAGVIVKVLRPIGTDQGARYLGCVALDCRSPEAYLAVQRLLVTPGGAAGKALSDLVGTARATLAK